MEEAPPIVQRVALLMCSITSVGLCGLKCALFCSLRIGRHSTGDHNIRQKYGCIYGALWTCPEGTVFAAVFVRVTTCNTLEVHTGHAHTFPLNTNSSQGRHPLMFSQRAPGMCGTPVFGAQPTLRFTNQLQNRQAPERRHARRSDCAFVMEGKYNICLVGCCFLPA